MKIARWAVEALGADYAQWRVLSRMMLKNDLRSSSAMQMAGSAEKPGVKIPWRILLMYGLYGLFMAALAAAVPGPHLSAAFVLLFVAMMLAMAILIDFQSVVISPKDYEILGPQPVSSRTYFLVKVTSVLLYTAIIGALMGGLATGPFLFRYGPVVALGWLVALAGTVVWTTMAMVYLYVAIVRLFSPRRLRRVLAYLQLVMSMVIFLPVVMDDLFEGVIANAAELPAALMLIPTTWFASLLPLAAGEWSVAGVLEVLVAFGSIAALLHFVGGRLSLSYAERMGVLLAASQPGQRRPRGGGFAARWFPAELRVVSTLLRGQFRNDMNFRLAVLGILPITLLYLFMSLRDGRLSDPFVDLGYAAHGLTMLHFAVLGMPLVLMENLFKSESYRASWVFFAAPVDRARLVGSTGNSVTIFFLVPYLAVVAGIFAWSFGNLWHAVAHTVVLGLISHLAIQMLLLAAPRLPFSEPVSKGARIGPLMGVILLGVLVAGLLPLFLRVFYARTAHTVAGIALLSGAAVLAPWVVTRRIRARVGQLEFTG